MRKLFASLMIVLAATTNSFAQETYLDIVINYTPTSMNFGENNDAIKDYRKGYWGLQAGASLQMGVTPHFSIVPELYFVMKGTKLSNNNPFTGQETRIRFNTIDVPFLARFHYKKVYLNAGPVVSCNIGGRIKTKANDLYKSSKTKLSFGSGAQNYSRFDAGLQFGGGYEFQLKKSRLLLDLRYHYGLVDMGNGTDMYHRYFNMNLLLAKKWKTNPIQKAKNRDLALWGNSTRATSIN